MEEKTTLTDRESMEIMRQMPEYHLYKGYLETGIAHDFMWSVATWIKDMMNQHENEVCDLQELVVKYSNGIFDENFQPNCGECKHYELQQGQEDCSSYCKLYESWDIMYKDNDFEECEGFERSK
jgi:hypothetical protein